MHRASAPLMSSILLIWLCTIVMYVLTAKTVRNAIRRTNHLKPCHVKKTGDENAVKTIAHILFSHPMQTATPTTSLPQTKLINCRKITKVNAMKKLLLKLLVISLLSNLQPANIQIKTTRILLILLR